MALDRTYSNGHRAQIDRFELQSFHVVGKIIDDVWNDHVSHELLQVQIQEWPHLFEALVQEFHSLLVRKQNPVRQIDQNAFNILRDGRWRDGGISNGVQELKFKIS